MRTSLLGLRVGGPVRNGAWKWSLSDGDLLEARMRLNMLHHRGGGDGGMGMRIE